MRRVPGIADARMQQSDETPQLNFTVDRARVAQLGLQEQDVTNAVATALAGTGQTAPNFWLDPKSNVSYNIIAQTPEYKLDSLEALHNLPVTSANGAAPQVLGALGTITRTRSVAVVTQYNILPTTDLYATTQDRDLGAVAARRAEDHEPPTRRNAARRHDGHARPDRHHEHRFLRPVSGADRRSAADLSSDRGEFPVLARSLRHHHRLPAALAGIVWMLFATGTTLSVPALTGAMMCMGVATANSILVVSFARERLAATGDPLRAAIEAGVTRFRPVLMTALAMIIGMLPMALATGRRRRAECALGPRRDRRPCLRHHRHLDVRAGGVQHRSWQKT